MTTRLVLTFVFEGDRPEVGDAAEALLDAGTPQELLADLLADVDHAPLVCLSATATTQHDGHHHDAG